MWRPRGRGKLSSEGRVSTLPARALEERRLAWSVRGTNENVSLWGQGGRTLQKDRSPRAEDTAPWPGDPHSLFQTCQVPRPRSQRQGSPLSSSIHGPSGLQPWELSSIGPLRGLRHRTPSFLMLCCRFDFPKPRFLSWKRAQSPQLCKVCRGHSAWTTMVPACPHLLQPSPCTSPSGSFQEGEPLPSSSARHLGSWPGPCRLPCSALWLHLFHFPHQALLALGQEDLSNP